MDHDAHWTVRPSTGFDCLWAGEPQSPDLPTPQLDTADNGSLALAHIIPAQFGFTLGFELARADVCHHLRSGLADDGCFAIKDK